MKLLEDLVDSLRQLPGVGQKTATRYAYDILGMDSNIQEELMKNIDNLKKIKRCQQCYGYTLDEVCDFCNDSTRSNTTLVVVANAKDMDKIEAVMPKKYYYFSIEGVIDPLNGKNIEDLRFAELQKKLQSSEIEELILVLPTNSEGELTASYIKKKMEPHDIKVTKLAQGVPIGGDLEYLDELTLLKSIERRQDY